MKKDINVVRIAFLIIIISACIAFIFGCKEKEQPPSTAPEIIEAFTKPTEDSLKARVRSLEDTVASLIALATKSNIKQEVAKSKVEQTFTRRQAAKEKKDTVLLTAICDEQDENFQAYVEATEKEDSVQHLIIITQEQQLKTSYAETELQKSKYKLLRDAYDLQGLQLTQTDVKLKNTEKKLRRSKFWGKVATVGAAAGAVLAGIVFL